MTKEDLVSGWEAYNWFVAHTFSNEEFVSLVDEIGVDAVFQSVCPYDDLTLWQQRHIKAVLGCAELREAYQAWWTVYNRPDVRDQLPPWEDVGIPWQPLE